MNRAAATHKRQSEKKVAHNKSFHLYHQINLTVDNRVVEMVAGDFAVDDLDRQIIY
jgi:hypothetical protein